VISLRKWSGGSAHLRPSQGALVAENALCWQQCFFTHSLNQGWALGRLVQWKSHLQKIENTSEPQNQFVVSIQIR